MWRRQGDKEDGAAEEKGEVVKEVIVGGEVLNIPCNELRFRKEGDKQLSREEFNNKEAIPSLF